MNVLQRARVIRKRTPDILKKLFDMSNRICDLCGHEIQDICLATLEHSTPVIKFAKCLDVAIEDAVRECNSPRNLRVAHCGCNSAKNDMTREEWFDRGLNNREAPRYMTDAEILEFRHRLAAGGRKGGVVSGRKKVETGEWARIQKLPQTIEARRLRGRIQGRKAFEDGTGLFSMTPKQKFSACRKGGRIGGRVTGPKNAASGFLKTICSDAGRIGGLVCVMNRKGLFGRSAEKIKSDARKGGLAAGLQNAVNHTGFCGRSAEKMSEDGRKAGKISAPIVNCLRWNVRRNKPCVCGRHA